MMKEVTATTIELTDEELQGMYGGCDNDRRDDDDDCRRRDDDCDSRRFDRDYNYSYCSNYNRCW